MHENGKVECTPFDTMWVSFTPVGWRPMEESKGYYENATYVTSAKSLAAAFTASALAAVATNF